MKLPDDTRFVFRKPFEHSLHEFPILDPGELTDPRVGHLDIGVVGLHVTHRFGHSPRDDFPNHDAARDHCQIGGQRTFSLETSENGKVVCEDGEKNLRAKIVGVVGTQLDAAGFRRVVDDVDEQTGKSIDEFTPRAAVASKTTLKKTTIAVSEGHVAPKVVGPASRLDGDILSKVYNGIMPRHKEIIEGWSS